MQLYIFWVSLCLALFTLAAEPRRQERKCKSPAVTKQLRAPRRD